MDKICCTSPCSPLMKSVGACSCDNINLPSESRQLMFEGEPSKRYRPKPKSFDELNLKSKVKLKSKAYYKKANKSN